jgi:hypothetical protein
MNDVKTTDKTDKQKKQQTLTLADKTPKYYDTRKDKPVG